MRGIVTGRRARERVADLSDVDFLPLVDVDAPHRRLATEAAAAEVEPCVSRMVTDILNFAQNYDNFQN